MDFHVRYDTNLENQLEKESFLGKKAFKKVEDLEKFLKAVYTDKAGVEFEHISNFEEKSWLYNRFEELMSSELTKEQQLYILRLMTESEVNTNNHTFIKKDI